jgi:hypothetical protein
LKGHFKVQEGREMDTETEKRGRGRPTIYTFELRDQLCRRIASGRTLRSVCRDDDMPCRETVEDWMIDCDNDSKEGKPWIIDEFLRHYARARRIQADNVHDECIDIADDGTNDFVERAIKGGKVVVQFDKEHVNRSRLRIDARQAWLQNTEPRVYGKNRVEIQALDKKGDKADLMHCPPWMEAIDGEKHEKKLK